MTNLEKFKEVFGVDADPAVAVLDCPHDENGRTLPCEWEVHGECRCENWWKKEFGK